MDINKLQTMLEQLPDAQLQQYMQRPNPQIPPVLLEMEVNRRAMMRKNAQMGQGGVGMAAGGMVRRFEDGGLVKDKYGRVYNKDGSLNMGHTGIGSLLDGMLRGGSRYDKSENQLTPFNPDEQQDRAEYQGLMQQVDQENKSREASAPKGIMQASPAPQTTPTAPPQASGILAAPTAPRSAPAPAPVQEGIMQAAPQPDLKKGLAEADEKADAMAAKAAEMYTQIASLREKGLTKPNEDEQARKAFFRGLAKFGAQLALTGKLNQAGVAGLEEWQVQLQNNEAKREEFKKESVRVALAKMEDQFKLMGFTEDQRARFRKEFTDSVGVDLKLKEDKRQEKELGLKEREAKSRERLTNAQIGLLGAQSKAYNEGRGGRGGASNQLTYEEAAKLVDDKIAKQPGLLRKSGMTREQLIAQEQDNALKYASGKLGSAQSGSGAGMIDFNALAD